MNKTVKAVFSLIGLLVLIFLIWQMFFNDGGILVTGYNALADGINKQWKQVAGDSQLIPNWGDNGAAKNGKGFDIGTGATGTGASQ